MKKHTVQFNNNYNNINNCNNNNIVIYRKMMGEEVDEKLIINK